VPAWNGLTDEAHPTQVLADLMTMEEFGERPLHELAFCYLGDARFNMGCSLLVGGVQMGMDVRIAAPAGLQPPADLVARLRTLAECTGAKVRIEADANRAVEGADFVYTDVWVSMGEPAEVRCGAAPQPGQSGATSPQRARFVVAHRVRQRTDLKVPGAQAAPFGRC